MLQAGNQDKVKALGEYVKNLGEWQKIVLGTNLVMGGGCLTILQNGTATGITRAFLVLAIVCFIAAVLFSVLQMSHLLNVLAAMTVTGSEVKKNYGDFTTRLFAYLHLIAFVFACIFFAAWILLKVL